MTERVLDGSLDRLSGRDGLAVECLARHLAGGRPARGYRAAVDEALHAGADRGVDDTLPKVRLCQGRIGTLQSLFG